VAAPPLVPRTPTPSEELPPPSRDAGATATRREPRGAAGGQESSHVTGGVERVRLRCPWAIRGRRAPPGRGRSQAGDPPSGVDQVVGDRRPVAAQAERRRREEQVLHRSGHGVAVFARSQRLVVDGLPDQHHDRAAGVLHPELGHLLGRCGAIGCRHRGERLAEAPPGIAREHREPPRPGPLVVGGPRRRSRAGARPPPPGPRRRDQPAGSSGATGSPRDDDIELGGRGDGVRSLTPQSGAPTGRVRRVNIWAPQVTGPAPVATVAPCAPSGASPSVPSSHRLWLRSTSWP
jgi:hypothetical protein